MLFLGVLAGIGMPMQNCVNTQLKKKLGSVYYATLVSFSVALVLSVIIAAALGQLGNIAGLSFTDNPKWIWIGGICGVIYLSVNVSLFSRLGAILTAILPIFGQIIMGLIIDQFGLFRSTQIPLSVTRIVGFILVLAGVIILTTAKASDTESKEVVLKSAAKWGWCVLGVAAGMFSAMQTAANGYLGSLLSSPFCATVISNVIGSCILAVIAILIFIRRKVTDTQYHTDEKFPWWIWIGGFFGQAFILVNAILTRRIGTGLTVVVVLIGIMAGGLLVDHFGWLRAQKHPVNARKVIGVILMLVGAVFIRLL